MLKCGKWLLLSVLGWACFNSTTNAQTMRPPGANTPAPQGFQPPTLSQSDGFRVQGVGAATGAPKFPGVAPVNGMGFLNQSNSNQPGTLRNTSFLSRFTNFFTLNNINRSLQSMGLLKPPPEPPVVILPGTNTGANDR